MIKMKRGIWDSIAVAVLGGLYSFSTTQGKIYTSIDSVSWVTGTQTLTGSFPDNINTGVTWTTRVSTFGANLINSIAYGNGLWVAAGENGQVRTSTNTITWVTQTSNFGTTSIRSMAYGNGRWVTVGFLQMRTSTNGVTWTTINSNFSSGSIISVNYNNNLWIATNNSGQVNISQDALTWRTGTSIAGAANFAVYGGGTWLIGRGSLTVSSTNGISWTTVGQVLGTYAVDTAQIAYGGGMWVAAVSDRLSTSINNGVSWISRTPPTTLLHRVSYSNGLWILGGYYGLLYTSTNAVNWTTRVSQFIFSWPSFVRAIAYGNDLWTIGGYQMSISPQIYKTDTTSIKDLEYSSSAPAANLVGWTTTGFDNINTGVTWTTRNTNTTNYLSSIAYSNGIWVLGTYGEQFRTSTDTITWITQNGNLASDYSGKVLSLEYGNGMWVAGTVGNIRTSTNAITWVTRDSLLPSYTSIFSIKYGNNIWLAGGYGGLLSSSTDTITWTRIEGNTSFAGLRIRSIGYKNNLWIVAGNSGHMESSTDTLTWTEITSGFGSTHIQSIVYDNGLWVAGGYYGQIRTSTDTITWVSINSTFTNSNLSRILSIKYANNLWMAGTYSGALRTSTNTITWVTRNQGNVGLRINGIAYGNGMWAMVGGNTFSKIQTSPQIILQSANTSSVYWTAGTGGSLYASTNSVNWVTNNTPATFGNKDINTIKYLNGYYIMGTGN